MLLKLLKHSDLQAAQFLSFEHVLKLWFSAVEKCAYLGTHSIINAIKKRTDILQMGNDAIHSSIISDITVYERSNECSSQLSVSNYQVFKSSNLQMFLKFLKIDRISLVYQSFYFILFTSHRVTVAKSMASSK